MSANVKVLAKAGKLDSLFNTQLAARFCQYAVVRRPV
jgi:hypothetical protein